MEKLSNSESVIMKAVWSADQETSVSDLMNILEERFGKSYKRTSIQTFLLKLEVKGFVTTTRRGKQAYIRPLVSEKDYMTWLFNSELSFWANGDLGLYLSALSEGTKLTQEDKDRLEKLLKTINEES